VVSNKYSDEWRQHEFRVRVGGFVCAEGEDLSPEQASFQVKEAHG